MPCAAPWEVPLPKSMSPPSPKIAVTHAIALATSIGIEQPKQAWQSLLNLSDIGIDWHELLLGKLKPPPAKARVD